MVNNIRVRLTKSDGLVKIIWQFAMKSRYRAGMTLPCGCIPKARLKPAPVSLVAAPGLADADHANARRILAFSWRSNIV